MEDSLGSRNPPDSLSSIVHTASNRVDLRILCDVFLPNHFYVFQFSSFAQMVVIKIILYVGGWSPLAAGVLETCIAARRV